MATARKTASKAEQLRVSQIGDFKSRMGGIQELPSGLVVKVRNPGGLTAFIANGTIPNSLLNIVKTTMDKNLSKGELVAQAQKFSSDLDSIAEMMELLDIITSQVIVEPIVLRVPTQEDVDRHNLLNPDDQLSTPEQLRREDVVYTDEVEDQDKQFLFQWITGGTRDLERFREQHERSLAAVSAEPGSEPTAELDAGADAG